MLSQKEKENIVELIKELETLYNNAVIENKKSFLWQDQEVLTSYAKYLLEYYSSHLKKAGLWQ